MSENTPVNSNEDNSINKKLILAREEYSELYAQLNALGLAEDVLSLEGIDLLQTMTVQSGKSNSQEKRNHINLLIKYSSKLKEKIESTETKTPPVITSKDSLETEVLVVEDKTEPVKGQVTSKEGTQNNVEKENFPLDFQHKNLNFFRRDAKYSASWKNFKEVSSDIESILKLQGLDENQISYFIENILSVGFEKMSRFRGNAAQIQQNKVALFRRIFDAVDDFTKNPIVPEEESKPEAMTSEAQIEESVVFELEEISKVIGTLPKDHSAHFVLKQAKNALHTLGNFKDRDSKVSAQIQKKRKNVLQQSLAELRKIVAELPSPEAIYSGDSDIDKTNKATQQPQKRIRHPKEYPAIPKSALLRSVELKEDQNASKVLPQPEQLEGAEIFSDTEKTTLLVAATNFEELYAAMGKVGPIHVNKKVFTAENVQALHNKIGKFRVSNPDNAIQEFDIFLKYQLEGITRAMGLRAVVEKLLNELKPEIRKKLFLVHMYARGDKRVFDTPETRGTAEPKKRDFKSIIDELTSTMEFARISKAEQEKVLGDIEAFRQVIRDINQKADTDTKAKLEAEYNKLRLRIQEVFNEDTTTETTPDNLGSKEPSPPPNASKEPIQANAVPSEKSPEAYENAKESLFAAKSAFLANKAAFEKRSLYAKMKDGFGFNNIESQKLKIESDSLRSVYAKALDAALTERSAKKMTVKDNEGNIVKENIQNKDYSLEADQTKIAFVKKFILTDRDKYLDLLKDSQSPEKKRVAEKILGFLKKNKWPMRTGFIVLAGAAGLMSGGAAAIFLGVGSKALRSATTAVSLASTANVLTQRGVVKKEDNFKQTVIEASKNFTLDNIDSIDAGVINAREEIKNARRKQTAATIGAGILGGLGVSGFSAAAEAFGAAPDGLKTLKTTPPDIITEPSPVSEIVNKVSNVELKTSPGTDIPAANQEAMNTYLVNKIQDFLHDRPNYNPDDLKNDLSTELFNKFGNNDWWPKDGVVKVGLNLEKVDVDIEDTNSVNKSEVQDQDLTQNEETPKKVVEVLGPVELVPEAEVNTYQVQRGDTLSAILNEQFKDKLSQVPEGRYNATLYNLLDKIQDDPKLAESLGIKGGDIDMIRTGEILNLGAVQEELDKLIAAENSKDTISIVSGISSEQDPSFDIERNVPDIDTNIEEALDITEYEKDQLIKNINTVANSADGYQSLAREYFIDDKAFRKAVDVSATKFEDNIYGFTDKLFGNSYSSPFKVMANMSVEKITDLAEGPMSEARAFCEKNNLKYEVFRDWTLELGYMQDKFLVDPKDTLVTTYERSVLIDKIYGKLN